MIKDIRRSSQFKKDLKRELKNPKTRNCFKKSKKDEESEELPVFYKVVGLLREGKPLPEEYLDHALSGNMAGFRECHLKPNLLLIYVNGKEEIELARVGSHNQVFTNY